MRTAWDGKKKITKVLLKDGIEPPEGWIVEGEKAQEGKDVRKRSNKRPATTD